MLKNTAFTGREGKPGRSKAHQFCLAERDSQPSWAVCSLCRAQVAQRLSQALTPVSQGQLLLEGQSGEAWSQSCQDQYISEAPDFHPVSKLQEGHVRHGMKREGRWGTLPAHMAEYVPGEPRGVRPRPGGRIRGVGLPRLDVNGAGGVGASWRYQPWGERMQGSGAESPSPSMHWRTMLTEREGTKNRAVPRARLQHHHTGAQPSPTVGHYWGT